MTWKTQEEIDWPLVQTVISVNLTRLFESPPNRQTAFELAFWIDTNGGLNFDVYQILPNGSQIRFGDIVEWWNPSISDLDRAFVDLLEELHDDDAIEAWFSVDERLKDLVRSECQVLQRKNFGYPTDVSLTWRVLG